MIDWKYREDNNIRKNRVSALRMKIAYILVVNMYVPNEEAVEEIKNFLYEKLENIYDQIDKHEAVITIAGFTVKIEKE